MLAPGLGPKDELTPGSYLALPAELLGPAGNAYGYSDAGTFTLRVLVTDDWYELGNPDSTGSAGDLWDETITVGGE